eukprot:756793-Hanusia_phi.AAC.1
MQQVQQHLRLGPLPALFALVHPISHDQSHHCDRHEEVSDHLDVPKDMLCLEVSTAAMTNCIALCPAGCRHSRAGWQAMVAEKRNILTIKILTHTTPRIRTPRNVAGC